MPIEEDDFEVRDFKVMQERRNKIFERMTKRIIEKHPNVSITST